MPLSASLPSAPSGAEGRGVLGGSRTCCLQCSCLISRAKKSALQQNTSITLLAAGGTYLPRPLNSGRGKPGSSRSGTHVSWEWKVEGYEDLRPRPAQSNTMELEVYWRGVAGRTCPKHQSRLHEENKVPPELYMRGVQDFAQRGRRDIWEDRVRSGGSPETNFLRVHVRKCRNACVKAGVCTDPFRRVAWNQCPPSACTET